MLLVSWIWCDGSFQENTVEISGADRGLCHGLGAFETILALAGEPVALDLHLTRLAATARTLGLKYPGGAVLTRAVHELLERSDLTEGRARVRITLTAGSGDLASSQPGADSRAWVLAAPSPVPQPFISLATAPFPRNELSPLAGMKTACYAENLLGLRYARERQADEPLFLNTCGDVCETATANIFVVAGGALLTPPLESGCLAGTARARVIELAEALGFETEERDLRPQELLGASCVFVTSAIRGVVEVTEIDRQPLPSVPLAGLLREGFAKDCAARRSAGH